MHLQILEQKMLSNEVGLAFSHNIESKQHLFILFLISVLMILCSQFHRQYCLITKTKHSKFRFNAATKKPTLE